jgi:hypothetical protein
MEIRYILCVPDVAHGKTDVWTAAWFYRIAYAGEVVVNDGAFNR